MFSLLPSGAQEVGCLDLDDAKGLGGAQEYELFCQSMVIRHVCLLLSIYNFIFSLRMNLLANL